MSASCRILLKTLAMLVLVALGTGCTRQFFRKAADQDVERLLTEKNVFEPWKIEQWHVYPDPRARFADPFDPDRPPMPPDDPAAQFLSPNPQRPGKAGVGRYEGTGYLQLMAAWDAMNRANAAPELPKIEDSTESVKTAQYIEPPDPSPGEQERPYLLNLEQCCELGLINSRDFQTQRENLYLTALPVTLQRFSFAAQLFALGNASLETSGSETPAGEGQRWLGSGSAGLTKVFPTGATLLAQLANNFVFDVTNGNPAISISSLTASLTQPLLRGGGRAITLEGLTQAERDLLYQIRAYARFRKQFYVRVAGGRSGGSSGANFVDPSLGALATALSSSDGYLPTLRLAAFLELDRQNVERLQRFLRLYEALAEGGQVPQLQVDQVKQDLLSAQSTVLSDELQLQNALDNFKIQLGMPPVVKIELDARELKPIRDQLNRFQEPIDQYQVAIDQIAAQTKDAEPATLRASLRKIATESALVKGTSFPERFVQGWGLWEKLTDAELNQRLASLREQRRRLLDERDRIEASNGTVPQEMLDRIAEIDTQQRFGVFEQELRLYESQPWKQLANPQLADQRRNGLARTVANAFELLLIDARNERFAAVQKLWPELPRICVDGVDLINAPLETAYAQASRTALVNRLDLMNARASLVDQWRQVAVQANLLLGVLDVSYSVNSTTPAVPPSQPFNFDPARTTQRLTFNGELPLVRRTERNLYRASLINYQRGRRALQATEDSILNEVRSELRQLRVLAQNYKIQQQQVVLAYNQVEQALEEFRQPATPTAGTGPPTSGGAGSTAALTQQLLNAQRRLNSAQTQLYRFWVDYITLRMEFFFDLELMPLDARGVWIDDHAYQCDGDSQSEPGVPTPNAPRGPDAAPVADPLPAPRPLDVRPPWETQR